MAKRTHRFLSHEVTGLVLAQEAEPKDVSIAHICRIVRMRKGAVLSCLAVALLSGGLYCLLAPRRYEAIGRVVINSDTSNPLGIAMADMPMALQDSSLVQETQVRILQSDTVAWDVIQQLRLDQRKELAGTYAGSVDTLDRASPALRQRLLAGFHDKLRVRSIPKTQLVEVSFRSGDAKVAADVVNGVTKAYVERNFRNRFDATAQASNWLARQLDDLKQNVESKQQEFVDFQKKTGIVGTDETHNVVVSHLDELNKHLATAQADRIVREARYREALDANPEVLAELGPTSALQILRAQEAETNSNLAQLTAKYGNSYPKVVQAKTQLTQVETALQNESSKVRQRLAAEYRAAAKAESMALTEVEKQKQQAYQLNEAGIHYLILKRELEGSRDLYEDLQKKLKEAGIVAGLKSTNVNVVDAAEIPVRPAEPRVMLALALAALLGGMFGLTAAFGLESLDGTISDPQMAERIAELPVLAVAPHVPMPRRRSDRAGIGNGSLPLTFAPAGSAFAEAFRVLRSTLVLPTAEAQPKVIAITSATPGEGKTVTAINIAVALAQNGRHVLLVDGDMRQSPLQDRLKLPAGAGLSSCITAAVELADVVVALPSVPRLEVLRAGERPPTSAELLGSERMRALIHQWRDHYDHILIDTPPVLGLSDALVVASMADAVLLVARYRYTTQQSLSRACDSLSQVGVRPAGMVFNDFDANSSHYYDYYGYHERTYRPYYAKGTAGNGAN